MPRPSGWASGTAVGACTPPATPPRSPPTVLWALSPVGPTGLRALLLFLPALAIYLLRVAQWHVGARHTQSPAETAKKYLFRKATLLTLAFYLFSAWLYSETYIWSRSPQHKLGFTELGREYERIKLNERPLYLRYLFMLLAVAQTAVHLCNDYDKIHVPAMAPRTEPHSATSALSTRRSPKPRHVLVTALPTMATRSASVAAAVWIAGSALYFFGPRHVAWEYYYRFSRKLWSLSKTSKPTGLSPFAPLALQFVTEGTLLVLLWEFVNKAFDLYIAQEPMKNGKPITDDSKDPNGTLLNGLKSKKDAVKVTCIFSQLTTLTNKSRPLHSGSSLSSPTPFPIAARPSTAKSSAKRATPSNKSPPSAWLNSHFFSTA